MMEIFVVERTGIHTGVEVRINVAVEYIRGDVAGIHDALPEIKLLEPVTFRSDAEFLPVGDDLFPVSPVKLFVKFDATHGLEALQVEEKAADIQLNAIVKSVV